MMKIDMLTDDDLLMATRVLVERSLAVTADLVAHLGEIDARQLYLSRAFPSMFAFCVGELGCSEDVAYNWIAARHIPDPTKRTVYERDGGQCTFLAPDGRRCAERACLEFDHADGFARTRSHNAGDIRLRCRAHNQFAADQMYGRGFMDEARRKARARDSEKRGRAGASDEGATQPLLP